MTITEKATGKVMFFVLSYVFPNGVKHTEKYHSKQGFKRRVSCLRRYARMKIITDLVV